MSKAKREYRLQNSVARQLSKRELFLLLCDAFAAENLSPISPGQEEGLRKAAEWIKDGLIEWRRVERAIQDNDWDPADGPRDILGPG